MKVKNYSTIYLDNASATPIDKKVLKLMSYYDKNLFANSTSIHKNGIKTRGIIDEARKNIATGLNAHQNEIIFTGSSTESIAMVILGVVNNFQLKNKGIIPHLITTEIEHPAVLNNFKLLENRDQVEVTIIPVDSLGFVDPLDIKKAIKKNTVLISVMYANNEIGTIQPIMEIAKVIRYYRKTNKTESNYPLFHTDATQAINYLDISNVDKLGVDLLSFNGSKIYGPKGVGVLYKKRNVKLSPIYSGGEQEFGLRSGTENVSSIAGLAYAFEITNKIKEKEVVRLTKLRDYAIEKLLALKISPFDIILNGGNKKRLPNNINISVKNFSSELLVVELDAKGIEVSSKSACKSDDDSISYVVGALRRAQGITPDSNEGSIRITLGRYTTLSDIKQFIYILSKILNKYRQWK